MPSPTFTRRDAAELDVAKAQAALEAAQEHLKKVVAEELRDGPKPAPPQFPPRTVRARWTTALMHVVGEAVAVSVRHIRATSSRRIDVTLAIETMPGSAPKLLDRVADTLEAPAHTRGKAAT